MFAVHPKMAKRWAKHTPKGKKLPDKVSEGDVETLVRPKEEAIYSSDSLNPTQVERLKKLGFEQDGKSLKHPKHWRVSSGILLPKTAQARAWLSAKARGEEDSEEFYHSPKAEKVPLSSVFKDAGPEKTKPSLKLVPKTESYGQWYANEMTRLSNEIADDIGEPHLEEPQSFEVQDFNQDLDPLGLREMPHLDADVDVGGKHLHIVDLRIERYPVSQAEKQRMFRAFDKSGLVGELEGELIHFKPDYTADVIDQAAAKQLPRLPHGWEKIMRFVSEAPFTEIPPMSEVFKKKGKKDV